MHNAITALCYHHTTNTGDHRGTRPRRPTRCNPSLSSPYPPGKPKTRPAHPTSATRSPAEPAPCFLAYDRLPAPTPPLRARRQLPSSPTFQQIDKPTSWQVGKRPPYNAGGGEPPSVTWSVHHTPSNTPHPRNPHLHHQPVPAASFLSYPAEPAPARPRPDAYPHHHTLARLLISRPPAEPRAHPTSATATATPPSSRTPPPHNAAKRPNPIPLSYPGVNHGTPAEPRTTTSTGDHRGTRLTPPTYRPALQLYPRAPPYPAATPLTLLSLFLIPGGKPRHARGTPPLCTRGTRLLLLLFTPG